MVGRTERRAADEPAGRQRQPGGGMDAGGLERLGGIEVGQQPRQPVGQHRSARPRRADEQQVVPAAAATSSANRAAGWPLHIGEVGAGRRRRQTGAGGSGHGSLPTSASTSSSRRPTGRTRGAR